MVREPCTVCSRLQTPSPPIKALHRHGVAPRAQFNQLEYRAQAAGVHPQRKSMCQAPLAAAAGRPATLSADALLMLSKVPPRILALLPVIFAVHQICSLKAAQQLLPAAQHLCQPRQRLRAAAGQGRARPGNRAVQLCCRRTRRQLPQAHPRDCLPCPALAPFPCLPTMPLSTACRSRNLTCSTKAPSSPRTPASRACATCSSSCCSLAGSWPCRCRTAASRSSAARWYCACRSGQGNGGRGNTGHTVGCGLAMPYGGLTHTLCSPCCTQLVASLAAAAKTAAAVPAVSHLPSHPASPTRPAEPTRPAHPPALQRCALPACPSALPACPRRLQTPQGCLPCAPRQTARRKGVHALVLVLEWWPSVDPTKAA
jgi:hypothetical protein